MIAPPIQKRIDLRGESFIGKVIYNNDPTFSGRCKVRVPGVMDGMDDGAIPWAIPVTSSIFASSGGFGSLSVPKVGATVRVRFQNGEYLSPEYSAIQAMDPNLVSEIRDDYIGSHVLLYDSDSDIGIIFQPKMGIKIYYKGSFIQITPDNMITLQHSGMDSIIQMHGKDITIVSRNSISISSSAEVTVSAGTVNVSGKTVNVGATDGNFQPAVLGNNLVSVLRDMMHQIDLKYPVSPGYSNPLKLNGILSNTVSVTK